jgi:hypothetical protein
MTQGRVRPLGLYILRTHRDIGADHELDELKSYGGNDVTPVSSSTWN